MIKLGKVPLERALSKLGVASRSQTKTWIEQGRIKVNGSLIKTPTYLVVPEKDRITLDGQIVGKPEWQTIMLYKPKGFVTTKSDEKGRKTVYDLLPQELQHLHPVGRLDMATSGLLLMTTDSQLSNYLTDPKNALTRVYIVTVDGKITEDDLNLLTNGIEDEGELLKPSKITLRKTSNRESHLTVELCEGKNREIRRMFEKIGHEVSSLKRVSFGKLNLGNLEPGQFRKVNKNDL